MNSREAYEVVRVALEQPDHESFLAKLREGGLELTSRGRAPGVATVDRASRFRLGTLGLLDRFNSRMATWNASSAVAEGDDNGLDDLCSEWTMLSGGEFRLAPLARASTRRFLNELGFDEVSRAMHKAAERISSNDMEGRFKYFCGICHNWIKAKRGGVVYCEPVGR